MHMSLGPAASAASAAAAACAAAFCLAAAAGGLAIGSAGLGRASEILKGGCGKRHLESRQLPRTYSLGGGGRGHEGGGGADGRGERPQLPRWAGSLPTARAPARLARRPGALLIARQSRRIQLPACSIGRTCMARPARRRRSPTACSGCRSRTSSRPASWRCRAPCRPWQPSAVPLPRLPAARRRLARPAQATMSSARQPRTDPRLGALQARTGSHVCAGMESPCAPPQPPPLNTDG